MSRTPGRRRRITFLDTLSMVVAQQRYDSWVLQFSRPDSDETIDVPLTTALNSAAYKNGQLNVTSLLAQMHLEPGEWEVELKTGDTEAKDGIEEAASGARVPWSGRFQVVNVRQVKPHQAQAEDPELAAKERQLRANELRIAELRQEKQLKELERQVQTEPPRQASGAAELADVLERLLPRQAQPAPAPAQGLGFLDLVLKAQPLIERLINRFIESANERNQLLAAAIAAGRQAQAPPVMQPHPPAPPAADPEAYMARTMQTTKELIGIASMIAEGKIASGGGEEASEGDAISRVMGVLNKVQEIIQPLMAAQGGGARMQQQRQLPATPPSMQDAFPGAVGPHLHDQANNGKKVADMQVDEGRNRILQWVLAVEREMNIGSDPAAVAEDATIQKGYQVTPKKFRDFLEQSEPIAVVAGMEAWIPAEVATRLRAACEQHAEKTDWLLAFLDALLGEPEEEEQGADAEAPEEQ